MRDIAIRLKNRPGTLADLGEALAAAGINIEGGGAFDVEGTGIAHFLFEDAATTLEALRKGGFEVLEDREVLAVKLNQDEPGQLGKISRMMADAGVNIEVVYSDHTHQLILVVDDVEKGRAISQLWEKNSSNEKPSTSPMKRVTGLGGVFFKCDDIEKMKDWYKKHLGIDAGQYGAVFEWRDLEAPDQKCQTAWNPFTMKSKYFDPSTKPFMFNYRVENLVELVRLLRAEGVQVVGEVQEFDYGKFGWIMDPEGNKIELWEAVD